LRVTIERTLLNLLEWREAVSFRDKLTALQSELSVANQIQQSILPTDFPAHSGYEVYGSMDPAKDIGGDFFDVMNLEGGRIGMGIADVSDKGVPAALFMMSCRTLLKGAAIGTHTPAEVLGEVNDLLREDNEAEMFVTLLYADYNPANGDLAYASGGHDAPLVIHPDGSNTLLPLTGGVALGVVPQFEYGQNTVKIASGDTVIMYTDGVTEAMNSEGEQFGLGRLREVFTAGPPASAEVACQAVFDAVRTFASDTPQSDDITCVTLQRKGG
jgi:sigma-B regulation protein RsbU (phosphoserine phosphatase)